MRVYYLKGGVKMFREFLSALSTSVEILIWEAFLALVISYIVLGRQIKEIDNNIEFLEEKEELEFFFNEK